ncbi:AAA family ATPase [Bacteroides heparinolyticus]|uniref:AAA family ATPase n=1 Tax=Prevotella heparinolytica TaxID=28113 RepID=UPI00359F5B50
MTFTTDTALLFIFSGLPAVGKSTLARFVAKEFGAVYLRIDTIEQGLKDLCRISVEGEGYRLAYRIASDNLRLGHPVVADCCNPVELTRREWEEVAIESSCRFVNIEVVCSDRTEHRKRAEQRIAAVPNLQLPTWDDIENREYHAWQKECIVIDTAGKTIGQCESELKEKIVNSLSPKKKQEQT